MWINLWECCNDKKHDFPHKVVVSYWKLCTFWSVLKWAISCQCCFSGLMLYLVTAMLSVKWPGDTCYCQDTGSPEYSESASVQAYVCVCICACVYICVCVYMCMCVHMCVCICACVYTCVCICACVYICVWLVSGHWLTLFVCLQWEDTVPGHWGRKEESTDWTVIWKVSLRHTLNDHSFDEVSWPATDTSLWCCHIARVVYFLRHCHDNIGGVILSGQYCKDNIIRVIMPRPYCWADIVALILRKNCALSRLVMAT